MADDRKIIDVILRARDDTAAAVDKAEARLRSFGREVEKENKRLEELANANERVGESIDKKTRAEERHAEQVRKARVDAENEFKQVKGISNARLEEEKILERTRRAKEKFTAQSRAEAAAMDALTKAIRKRGEANRDETSSQFDRIKATEAVIKAEKDLSNAINDRDSSTRSRGIKGFKEASRVRQIQEEIEAERQRTKIADEAFKIDKRRRAEELKDAKDAARAEEKLAQDKARAEVGAAKERAAAISRINRSAEGLADPSTNTKDQQKFRDELKASRRALIANGLSGVEANNAIRDSVRAARLEQGFANKAQLDSRRNYLETAKAVEGLAKASERLRAAQGAKRDLDARKAPGSDPANRPTQGEELEVQVRLEGAREEIGRLQEELQGINARVDVKTSDPQILAETAKTRALITAGLRNINAKVDVDVDGLSRARNAIRSFGNAVNESFRETGQRFQRTAGQVAQFDNFLRGLLTGLAAVFAEQLIQIAGAAVGVLASLAASAVQAGAALGGVLAAGAAQGAIGLGVLVAAASRVKGVLDAVKQSNLLNEQQSYAGEKAANKQASAIDGVKNAQESLADAHRRVKDAQDGVVEAQAKVVEANENLSEAQKRVVETQGGLGDARKEAVKELQDLVQAEREAQLAAEGAVLSQVEAQKALQEAIRGGDTGDIASRQLAVRQSNVDADNAQTNLRRSRDENNQGQAAGVEGSDAVTKAKADIADAQDGVKDAIKGVKDARKGVGDAREQVADAERGVVRAQRALQQARRSATEAAEGTTSAAGKLNYLLAQMSDAERRLFRAIQALSTEFKKFSKEVTEPLINSFTRAVRRVTQIIQMPSVVTSARATATAMAKAFDRVFDAFTSNRAISQFLRISKQLQDNMKPLSAIAISFGRAFLNIAEGAGPSFNRLLRYIAGIGKAFEQTTTASRRSGGLAEYFQKGTTHLIAWIRLMGSIGRLFLAISGPGGGAASGLKSITSLTKTLNGFADEIGTKGTKANKFWNDFFKTSRGVMRELTPILKSLAREFALTFNDRGVKGARSFATIMSQVLIPALGTAIRFVGGVTRVIGGLLENNPGLAKFLATLIGFTLAAGVLAKLTTAFRLLLAPIGILVNIAGKLGILSKLLGPLNGMFGRIGTALARIATSPGTITKLGSAFRFVTGPVGLVIGLMISLIAYAGKLDDVFRAFRGVFTDIWKRVKAPLADVVSSFKDMWKELRKATTEAGPLKTILDSIRPVLKAIGSLLGDQVVAGLKTFGEVIGDIAGSSLSSLAGVFKIISGLASGDFSKVGEGFKQVGKGIVDGILAPIRGIGRLIVRLFRSAVNAVKDFLGIKSPSTVFKDIGGDIVRGIINGIGNFARRIARILNLGEIVDDMRRGARRIVTAIVGGLRAVGGRLKDFGKWVFGAISDAIHGIGGFLENIGSRIMNAIVRGIKAAAGKVKNAVGDVIGGAANAVGLGKDKAEKNPGGGNALARSILPRPTSRQANSEGRRQERGSNLGGAVKDRAAKARIDVSSNIDSFFKEWNATWRQVLRIATRFSNQSEGQVRNMRVNITRSVRRMRDDVENQMFRLSDNFHTRWDRMTTFAAGRVKAMVKSMDSNFGNLKNLVFDGFSYIGATANKALKAFDSDPVKLSLDKPGKKKAEGGFVGSPGERGGDNELTWLGRGEAVLNWGQQKAVNAALRGQDTLASIVGRTGTTHAGTVREARGYAGGKVGLMGALPIMAPFARMGAQYGLVVSSGKRAAGGKTSSGNISNHGSGNALDISGPANKMVQFARALAKKFGKKLDELIHTPLGYGVKAGKKVGLGFWGSAVNADHNDHVHVGYKGSGKLGGIGGIGGEEVGKVRVRGKDGTFRNVAQSLIDRVRKAANEKINENGGADDGASASLSGINADGGVARTLIRVWKRLKLPFKALLSAFETGIVESGMRNLGGGDADSAGWRQERASLYKNPTNVVASAGRFFNEWKQFNKGGLTAGQVAANVQRPRADLRGRYDQEREKALNLLKKFGVNVSNFNRGGHVPGYGGGDIVPAMVEPGEHILRKDEVKAAGGHGAIYALRRMLGGGTKSNNVRRYALGGEVIGDDDPVGNENKVSGIDAPEYYRRKAVEEARFAALEKSRKKELSKAEKDLHERRMKQIEEAGEREKKRYEKLLPFEKQLANIRAGIYTAGLVPRRGVEGTRQELGRANRAIGNLRRKSGTGEGVRELFLNNISALTDEGGIFDQVAAEIERFGTRLETDGKLALAGFRRLRRRVGRGRNSRIEDILKPIERETDEVAQGQRTSRNALAVGRESRTLRRDQANTLRQVEAELRRVERNGITDDEKTDYQKLIAQRNGLMDGLDELDSKIADSYAAYYDALRTTFEKQTENALKKGQNKQLFGEALARFGNIIGSGATVQNQALDLINSGLKDQIAIYSAKAKLAQKNGYKDLSEEYTKQVADLSLTVQENLVAKIRNNVEAVNNTATKSNTAVERIRRVQAAFGIRGQEPGLIDQQIASNFSQQRGLNEQLRAAQKANNTGLVDELTEAINDVNATIFELVANRLRSVAEEASRNYQRGQASVSRQLTIAQAFGQTGRVGDLMDFQNAFRQQRANQLQDLLNQSRAQGNQGLAEELEDELADLQAEMFNAVIERLNFNIEQVNKSATRASGILDIRGRIASALGRNSDLAGIFDDRIESIKAQIAALRPILASAQASGAQEQIETLTDQISDLETQVVEQTAQRLQNAIEQIATGVTRDNAALDIRDRMAQLLQLGGNATGAAAARTDVLRGRGNVLAGQRNALYGILAQAQAEGNEGLVRELTDQLADLDASIAENTQAVRDSTTAQRQVAIDAINSRQSFGGGVGSGLTAIINAVGTITGQLDNTRLKQQADRDKALLDQTGTSLREQLNSIFGVNLIGQSGLNLVDTVAMLDFDALTAGMTEADRAQFEALVNAVLENEQAVLGNTQTIAELNGQLNQPQGFSSSAWQFFRSAIFDGMGGLLPQYANSSISGVNAASGMYSVSTPASNVSGGNISTNNNSPSITINEAGGPVDVVGLSARLAFESKTR